MNENATDPVSPALPALQIDFVSDVSCPWCAIGLSALLKALERLSGEVDVGLRCHPFELNPAMPPGGQDIGEHLTQKYGSTPEQQAQIRATIAQRGADAGFVFNEEGRGRIYNTFNAHRLLQWAAETAPEKQVALKMALLTACHRGRQAMDDPVVLRACAVSAGLDAAAAQAVLDSQDHAQEVRQAEEFFTSAGISAVPAVVINQRHLVSGGQTAEIYERVLREIVAKTPAAGAVAKD